MVAVVVLPMDGGYKPRGNLVFEPYPVRQKRLGLADVRNKGPMSLIPEAENEAHKARMTAYWRAIHAEEEAKKVHTCADWEFDPDADSPYEWCPACRHAEWLRSSRASQQALVAAYLADKYPQPPKPSPQPQKPFTLTTTRFMAEMIAPGDATAQMLRDSLTPGMMRPWWYYCEKSDPEWLTRKMPERQPEVVVVAKPAAAAAPAEPAFFRRVAAPAPAPAQIGGGGGGAAAVPVAALSADTDARVARFNAWMAQERRRERKPFFRGRMVAGSCAPSDNKVVVKNLPLNEPTLQADMWEAVAAVAPVADIYQPKAMFITLSTAQAVEDVLAAFPNGLNYNGTVVRFERAGRR